MIEEYSHVSILQCLLTSKIKLPQISPLFTVLYRERAEVEMKELAAGFWITEGSVHFESSSE